MKKKVNMKVERLGVRYIIDTYTQRERNAVRFSSVQFSRSVTVLIMIFLFSLKKSLYDFLLGLPSDDELFKFLLISKILLTLQF